MAEVTEQVGESPADLSRDKSSAVGVAAGAQMSTEGVGLGLEKRIPTRINFKERLRQKKMELGLPVSPERKRPDNNALMTEGSVILHELFSRVVIRYPQDPNNESRDIVKKWGIEAVHQEVSAMRLAESAGICVPHVYGVETAPDGRAGISMDYVEGQPLSDVWPALSDEEKHAIAAQLRSVLEAMRSIPPPEGLIGGTHPGEEIRDTRIYMTFTGPPCKDEDEFNTFLLSSLFPSTPSPIRRAFAEQLRSDHRIVFTHGDLAPRNIMYKDGKIVGLIDWQDAGWYPEYWEYVKFFFRSTGDGEDWRDYADEIFPSRYPSELVDYIAVVKWQPS